MSSTLGSRGAIALVGILIAAAGCATPRPTGVPPDQPAVSADANGSPPAASSPDVSSPRLTPVPTSPLGEKFELVLDDGTVIPVTIIDEDDIGVTATAGTEAQRDAGGRAMANETDTSVIQVMPTELLVTWVGSICERGFTLLVSTGGVSIRPDPRKGCDLVRQLYAVVLRFEDEREAARFTVDLKRPVILDH